jgi:hypothetical protein
MYTNCNKLILLPLVMLVAGCEAFNYTSWQASFEQEQGHLVLDCEQFRVRFDGVNLAGSPVRGGASFSLQVSGGGTSIVNLNAYDHTLTSSWSSGVNTITLKQHELRILGGGKQLQIGSSIFDLGGEKKSLIVRADGTVTAR